MYRDNLYHAARYFRICTFDTELRRSYLQKLRREKQSDSIINVYEKFCGRVVDEDGVKWVTKQEHWKWLSTNLFCKTVGEIVSPAGWRGLQLQRGTESHERLEATTQRLCEQLRSNKIDLNEAIFKLEQEANLYDRQAGSDHAKQFLSFAMDYFN